MTALRHGRPRGHAVITGPRAERLLRRRRYQAEVARLLERIGMQTRRVRLLEAGGARAALPALERETARTREQLATLVAHRA